VEIDQGKTDRGQFLALRDQITIQRKAPAKPSDDVVFWKEFFLTGQGRDLDAFDIG
jgi:hypothetical protein